MASAVKTHSPSAPHTKPSVPPKPLRSSPFKDNGKEGSTSTTAKRSRITPPTSSPPPPPTASSSSAEQPAHLTQALVLAEEARARSQGNSPTGTLNAEKSEDNHGPVAKQGSSGVQVKRSHSTAAETGARTSEIGAAKVKRHHSVREGKEIPQIQAELEDGEKSPKSKFGILSKQKRSARDESDIQARMRDCLWSPLTSFVVKTKAEGAALVEKGSRKLFGKSGLPFRGKKTKKRPPTPPLEEDEGTIVRSRPKVPPRPLLHRLLEGIATKEQGVWHKLDHVKYIDEEVSTEDSTDYTDVDWGKALNTDPGEEDIIYYTFVEEAPNEKVVFFQRLKHSQVYSSSDEETSPVEVAVEQSISHVAEMENMEIDTETKEFEVQRIPRLATPERAQLSPEPDEQVVSVTVSLPSDRTINGDEEIPKSSSSDSKLSEPEASQGLHTVTATVHVEGNGDENANVMYVNVEPPQATTNIYENAEVFPVVEISESVTLTPGTRKKSPQYASVQKMGAPEKPGRLTEIPKDKKLNDTYYDLDVQEKKPKIKPKRPPLPRKPSRPAPPVPPKTYMSLRFPPRKVEEVVPEKEHEQNLVDEDKENTDANIVVTEAEIVNMVVNGDLEGVKNDLKEEQPMEINGEETNPNEQDICEEDNKTVKSLPSEAEVLSLITESIVETVPDDLSERRSHWADSEASLEKHIPHWESRSVSVPPSMTSESGFISSPTPPPRQRKFRHHSVEGVMQKDYSRSRDSPNRRSKSCSDADVARKPTESPVSKGSRTSTLTRDASTNTKPQRPPRPALKPKPGRPPKPLPQSIKKLAVPGAVKEEGASIAEGDAISVSSSCEEGSPRLARMRSRPLPPPPAPPRQRSPRPAKKPIFDSEPSPTPEPQPPKSISSVFPLEFLHKLSEIEAGRLNLSEINVKKINVDEIDASVIRVSALQVGQMTPLALLTKQTQEPSDSGNIESELQTQSAEGESTTKKEEEEEKNQSEEEKQNDKKDDEDKKKDDDKGGNGNGGNGKKDDDKKDDDDDKGGNGGGGDGGKRDDQSGDKDSRMDEDEDSQPPDWWKDSVPPSEGPNQDAPNSTTTGNINQTTCSGDENKQQHHRESKRPLVEKPKVIDRLIITPSLPCENVSNSIFYTNEENKGKPLSRSPSQKSSSSNSSREDKPTMKQRHRKTSKSSWYDEGSIPGHSGDIDTSDGWIEGGLRQKRLSLSNEKDKDTQNAVDSDVEGTSQVRRQIASLFSSFNSRERKKSSQFYTKEDSHDSSSTTDTEQDDPKNVRPITSHRVRSLSSGCSPRSPQDSYQSPEWPKIDQNANYTDDKETKSQNGSSNKNGIAERLGAIKTDGTNKRELKASHSFPSNHPLKLSSNSSDLSSPVIVRRLKTSDNSSASSIPHDPSRRLTGTSICSEDSWLDANCSSEDTDTESSFLTSQSCFEGEVLPDAAEHRQAKKYLIAREMMTSEQVFVDVLKLLNEDFRNVIIQANSRNGHKIIPEGSLNHILRYLPQLQNLNEDLLKDLTERIDKWDEIGRIADVIVKKGPFLKLYSAYIKDFESITAALDEACRKYPDFAQIVKEFEMSERCQRLAIKHYMLKPVQRIPQYKLLLEDYLKHLKHDSPDYQDTITALNIVTDVANHANQTMKEGDNFAKLLRIQNSLIGNYEIIKPGRLFIKEGELFKLSRKVMQPRWFILFNDCLLHTDMAQQGTYRLHHELALTGMKVMLPTNEEYQNEFSIISVSRSFTLSANSPLERDEWISTLNKAIEANAARRGTFASAIDKQSKVPILDTIPLPTSLGKQAPVWIPDARVTMCQLCTFEFTVTFRRHHCRACGKVVCSNCSANRAPLQYLKFQAVRVCDECFDKLAEEFEASENTLNESDGSTECGASDGKNSGSEESGLSATRANIKAQFKRFAVSNGRKIKRYLPKVLKEVSANHQGATYSGYLQKRVKKSWRKLWFVIHDKVLYTYKASEDVAALESIPLLGFKLDPCSETYENVDPKLVFQLTHPGHSPIIFHAENIQAVEKWTKAMESATVL